MVMRCVELGVEDSKPTRQHAASTPPLLTLSATAAGPSDAPPVAAINCCYIGQYRRWCRRGLCMCVRVHGTVGPLPVSRRDGPRECAGEGLASGRARPRLAAAAASCAKRLGFAACATKGGQS
jgi:hypothetical protein